MEEVQSEILRGAESNTASVVEHERRDRKRQRFVVSAKSKGVIAFAASLRHRWAIVVFDRGVRPIYPLFRVVGLAFLPAKTNRLFGSARSAGRALCATRACSTHLARTSQANRVQNYGVLRRLSGAAFRHSVRLTLPSRGQRAQIFQAFNYRRAESQPYNRTIIASTFRRVSIGSRGLGRRRLGGFYIAGPTFKT